MIVYSVILFAAATAAVILGICIAWGNANLINCYRPERVKDKPLYCRKMGQAMYLMAAGMTVSGIIGLLGEDLAVVAVVILITGELCGIARLFSVQKTYGGGIF